MHRAHAERERQRLGTSRPTRTRERAAAARARAAAGARGADERRAAHASARSSASTAASIRARSRASPARSGRRSSSCGRRDEQDSLIAIVVSWELCWYRYEVDLSDGGAAVRLAGQGYELSEIPVEDRVEAERRRGRVRDARAGLIASMARR